RTMVRGAMLVAVIAVFLCAMGAGMLLLGVLTPRHSRAAFIYTGLLAIAYGTRLVVNTSSFALMSGRPPWLGYVRSAFEYLVPIPAAPLFQWFSGDRWRTIHRISSQALIGCYSIAHA